MFFHILKLLNASSLLMKMKPKFGVIFYVTFSTIAVQNLNFIFINIEVSLQNLTV